MEEEGGDGGRISVMVCVWGGCFELQTAEQVAELGVFCRWSRDCVFE